MMNRIRYSKAMFYVRETHAYAYLNGLCETLRWGSGSGKTHETDQGWNDAYDKGMSHAEWIQDHITGNGSGR